MQHSTYNGSCGLVMAEPWTRRRRRMHAPHAMGHICVVLITSQAIDLMLAPQLILAYLLACIWNEV